MTGVAPRAHHQVAVGTAGLKAYLGTYSRPSGGCFRASSGETMAEKIERANRSLLEVSSRRGRRNKDLLRADGRVHQTVAQQAGADFISAIEEERGRIARELHDNAGQSLTGILLNIEVLERDLSSAGTEVLARLARCRELACATLDQIRGISHRLNPPEWSEQDFPTALESLVESMGLRDLLLVELGDIEVPGNLSPAIQTILYRTLQEGLTNVLRHSRARRVRIEAPL